MVNNSPRLTGKQVMLDGRSGTVIRWASQSHQPMVLISWEDGTQSWHRFHDLDLHGGEPAAPVEPKA